MQGEIKINFEKARISEEKVIELLKELETGGILLMDNQPAFPLKVKA